MPDPQQVAELFFAHAKVRSAALQIAEVSRGSRELEKLASELMTMACVTEIVAYAVERWKVSRARRPAPLFFELLGRLSGAAKAPRQVKWATLPRERESVLLIKLGSVQACFSGNLMRLKFGNYIDDSLLRRFAY